MKIFIYIFLALLIFIGSSSVFAIDSYYPEYEILGVDELYAVGVKIEEPANPEDHLQNQMNFYFMNEREHYKSYQHQELDANGSVLWSCHIELNLIYSRVALESKDPHFITGTFRYFYIDSNTQKDITGDVQGGLTNLKTDYDIFDFANSAENAFEIILQLNGTNANYVHGYPLTSEVGDSYGVLMETEDSSVATSNSDPTETVLYNTANTDNSSEESYYTFDERWFSHEESPHIPSPYRQADVAAGVGLSTVGIVVANALAKTSVFGSASYNGSFNPSAAPTAQPGAPASPGGSGSVAGSSASSGMASSAASAQQSVSASMSQGASASGGGGFIKSIGDFFKGLFDILRDMLTDEGRSYASGKVTDLLSDTDLTDFGDNE